jgi:hypothetical protein
VVFVLGVFIYRLVCITFCNVGASSVQVGNKYSVAYMSGGKVVEMKDARGLERAF